MWKAQREVAYAIRYTPVRQVWLCWGLRAGKTAVVGSVGIPEYLMREDANGKASKRVAVVSSSIQDIGVCILRDAGVVLAAHGYKSKPDPHRIIRREKVNEARAYWDRHYLIAISYEELVASKDAEYDAIFLEDPDWQKDPMAPILAAKKKLAGDGFLFVAGSPSSPTNPLLAITTALEGLSGVYTSHLASWEANDVLTVDQFESGRETNYSEFERDFAAYKFGRKCEGGLVPGGCHVEAEAKARDNVCSFCSDEFNEANGHDGG